MRLLGLYLVLVLVGVPALLAVDWEVCADSLGGLGEALTGSGLAAIAADGAKNVQRAAREAAAGCVADEDAARRGDCRAYGEERAAAQDGYQRAVFEAQRALAEVEASLRKAETACRRDFSNQEVSLGRQVYRLVSEHSGLEVELLDPERRYLEIRLNGSYLGIGTDAACAAASTFFHQLTSLEDGTLILNVLDPWVPSIVNPMDRIWAAELADLGGAPGHSAETMEPEEHQARVDAELTRRGVGRAD